MILKHLIPMILTSSLKSLLTSCLIGSRSCTCPAENPINNSKLSADRVNKLKSWQVGIVPLYSRLSRGFVRSAAYRKRERGKKINMKNKKFISQIILQVDACWKFTISKKLKDQHHTVLQAVTVLPAMVSKTTWKN